MTDSSDDDEPRRGRGRPHKDLPAEQVARLLVAMRRNVTFAEACRRVGTSAHVVRKFMRVSPRLDYTIRFTWMAAGKRKLSERGADPDICLEAALSAHTWIRTATARSWEEVQESIRRRAERGGMEGQGFERAMREPVTIPEARTAEEEAF